MKPDTWLTAWKLWGVFVVALVISLAVMLTQPPSSEHIIQLFSMAWLLFFQGLILVCDAFVRWAFTWPDPDKRQKGGAR